MPDKSFTVIIHYMKQAICLLIISLCTLNFTAIAQGKTKSVRTAKRSKIAKIQYGTATFYHNKFDGRRTANGEIFSQKKFTAAHNSVPLGTWLKVTNLRNKKSVIVQVTDRLHYRSKRLVDLSKAAALKILFLHVGFLPVKVEILGKSSPVTKAK